MNSVSIGKTFIKMQNQSLNMTIVHAFDRSDCTVLSKYQMGNNR